MNRPTLDLFGDQHVSIPDNPVLEEVAGLILRCVEQDPGLLNGDRMGDIDRKIRIAVWLSSGLDFLSQEQKEQFILWAADPKRCVDPEVIRRARQWLVEHDYIRLPAAAIKQAEQMRSRLAGSFRK